MDVDQQLEQYREMRRRLEEAILPFATSIDGRRFEFQSSLYGLAFQPGGYVVLEGEGGGRLGQITSLAPQSTEGPELMTDGEGGRTRTRLTLRAAAGSGVLLDGDPLPFHDALARPATSEEVNERFAAARPRRAGLEIGELLLAPGVPIFLDAGGFDRHTFLCGQSGSGKTYSLGLVLERLLLETDLQIVILDPNSDYVRLGETRSDADPELGARHAALAPTIDVRRAPDLHLAFGQLGDDARAAVLDLDPIADREEYATMLTLLETAKPATIDALGDSEEGRPLQQRARNLGVLDWEVWSRGRDGSVLDALERRDARCLVVDLGSLGTRHEQAVAAESVLATLWRRRADRRPVLIVIDEAHNVCPQHPEDRVTALATDLAVRIAGEGRKFGLYLLVSTQRPQKVHENVLSQCDNLLLMRMNSTADLGFVADVFSFVPGSLLERATTFRQGEALVAGKVAWHPGFVRFGRRIAEEGGADVPADWARPT